MAHTSASERFFCQKYHFFRNNKTPQSLQPPFGWLYIMFLCFLLFYHLCLLLPLLLYISKPKLYPPVEVCGTNLRFPKVHRGRGQYFPIPYLDVVSSNWVADNWVYRFPNEGTKNGSTVQTTGTRAHLPKPPFCKPALLFPVDFSGC